MISSHVRSESARLFSHIYAFSLILVATLAGWICFFEPASTRYAEIKKDGLTTHPVTTLHFRGDIRFTPHQREIIELSIHHIEKTSCGFVKINITWDMSNAAMYIIAGRNVIVATTTEELKRIKGPDAEYNLGLTVNLEGFKWIFLVMPKLDDDKRLEWVIAHEITHAAGVMDHDDNGLMTPEAPWLILPDEYPTWSKEDVELFCQRWRCDPKLFDSCRFR